jgi:hypothetical protein
MLRTLLHIMINISGQEEVQHVQAACVHAALNSGTSLPLLPLGPHVGSSEAVHNERQAATTMLWFQLDLSSSLIMP